MNGQNENAAPLESVERIRGEIAKYDIRFKFFRHIVTAIGWLLGLWLILRGLEPILLPGGADEIRAISHLVSALRPGSFIGYVLAVVFLLYTERNAVEKSGLSGRRRGYREYSRRMNQIELPAI